MPHPRTTLRPVFGAAVATVAAVAAVATAVLGLAGSGARAEVGAYLLFDMASGEVIAEHEATRPWYPASITKLMTAYVTFAAVEAGEVTLSSPVRITPQAHGQPPSRLGLPIGSVITVEAALRIILTKSANDVSVALAEAIAGTQAGFAARMNATAVSLGMSATHYDNPHGLPDPDQVTSARDIALLMMALQNTFPDRADYFAMTGVRLGNRTMPNHNRLMRRFSGADGMKTGFICASGFNLAATATRQGHRLGAVVLGGLTSIERDQRAAELLAKGFTALANGGSVALDGFGDPPDPLALAPVAGTREEHGPVADLRPRPGAEPADRREAVCGARRPTTRYDEGTVATVAQVEAARETRRVRDAERARRARERERILSTPLPRPAASPALAAAPADGAAPARARMRRTADASLAGAHWSSPHPRLQPAAHPRRSGSEPPEPPEPLPLLAPEGWRPLPARPLPNPFEVAGLRAPLPPEPQLRPLDYFDAHRPVRPVAIALGGADAQRPNPQSGTVVGGGPAPRPMPKPLAAGTAFGLASDPDDLIRHAAEVRASVAVAR